MLCLDGDSVFHDWGGWLAGTEFSLIGPLLLQGKGLFTVNCLQRSVTISGHAE